MNQFSQNKHHFRCAGCEKMKRDHIVFVPWFKTKNGPQTETMGFCAACASLKKRGETGRALSLRMKRGES